METFFPSHPENMHRVIDLPLFAKEVHKNSICQHRRFTPFHDTSSPIPCMLQSTACHCRTQEPMVCKNIH
uniref:Uncharacterized protein n=1 Tax=Arundo donax TaxID=35708 RepID=A0A0A9BI14_ARUDO